MHASVVVLCALVAVAAGQYYPLAGVLPLNPALGVPLETPEVMHAKAVHAVAWNNAAARSSGWLLRKRREAPAAEAPEAPAAEHEQEKRQIMPFGYGFRSPLAYSAAWPAYSYSPLATPYLYRKRRDVSEEQPAVEEAPESREKRQFLAYSTYGLRAPLAYSAWSYPYTLPAAVPATIPASTYFLRKRRDVSEEASVPEAEKEKRQIFLSGYGYRSPLAYTAPLAYPYSPYSPFLYRKRREAEAAPEENTAEKEKRQIIIGGLGYGYAPIIKSAVVPSWPAIPYASPYFG